MGTTSRNAVYTYQNLKAPLTANTHGEDYYDLTGTITIETPSEIVISSEKEIDNLKLRYSVDGKDKGEASGSSESTSYNKTDGKLTLENYTDITINGSDISLTVQDVKEAIAKGTNITKTVTIVWSVYDTDSVGYVATAEKNGAEAIVSVTETVTISIDPYTVTFTSDGENVWTPSDAQTYKATLVPATPAEENKTTEDDTTIKKDDVPTTGEVIPMALVGIR